MDEYTLEGLMKMDEECAAIIDAAYKHGKIEGLEIGLGTGGIIGFCTGLGLCIVLYKLCNKKKKDN